MSPIGFGTWGIGGRGHRDMALTKVLDDSVHLEALNAALDIGMNHTEVSAGYGHGNALRLVGRALGESRVDRTSVFVTHSVFPRDLADFADVHDDEATFREQLSCDFADSTLVTETLLLRFGELDVCEWLDELLDSGRSRFVSLSNASPECVARFAVRYGDHFAAHATHLSYLGRAALDDGVIAANDTAGVRTVLWRPLQGGMWGPRQYILEWVARNLDASLPAVIISWLVSHRWYPIVQSTRPDHVAANWAAANLELEPSTIAVLDQDRRLGAPAVRWATPQVDDDLALLAAWDGIVIHR